MNRPSYLISAEGVTPGRRVPQQKTLALALAQNSLDTRQKRLFKAAYGKVGVETRYSVLSQGKAAGQTAFNEFFLGKGPGTEERMLQFEAHAPKLAHDASKKAIQASGVSSKKIAHLVSVSCTGFAAPGFDISILRSLGLDPSASRTHIGFMGCHGVFNALRVASALNGPGRDVLVCSVELCSLHYRHGRNIRKVLGNSLFSDGAAAAIISSTKNSPDNWLIAAQGSFVIPVTEEAIQWRIGDLGFEMGLSPMIPQFIKENLRAWLEAWLAKENMVLKDIRSWAVHPGGPGVLDAVEESMSMPKESLKYSRNILKSFGNMSSATILFILHGMMRRKAATPCVALGFGPGLTIEAVLFL